MAPATTPVSAPKAITAPVGQDASGTVAPVKMTTIAGVHATALIETHRHG